VLVVEVVLPGGGVVAHVAARGLVAQPLAQVALGVPAALRELLRRRRALRERAVEPEPVADHGETGRAGRAGVGHDLADQPGEFVVVHRLSFAWPVGCRPWERGSAVALSALSQDLSPRSQFGSAC